MIKPYQLSNQALAVLRTLAQAGTRKSGSTMALATIERSWTQSRGDLEVGLTDLEIARLVEWMREEERVIVSDDGEAFFESYFHSCY